MNAIRVSSKSSPALSAAGAFGVIWLHGLGASGHDFEPLIPELVMPAINAGHWPAMAFVLPHAPHRPVTINGGYVMPAWYDITSLDRSALGEAPGLRDSIQDLHAEIRAFSTLGIPPERVFVVGFSQGGAVALAGGLRFPQRLAGIVGLSTYLPLLDSLPAELEAANKDTPIWLALGSQDPVVTPELTRDSRAALQKLGVESELKSYPMQHSVCDAEVSDLRAWMQRVIDDQLRQP